MSLDIARTPDPCDGPRRFARYAAPPNARGFCGPDAVEFSEVAAAGPARELRQLATAFEGAYPYLELLAASSASHDPLGDDVVEAYWLGSGLLDRVDAGALGHSLDARFRRRAGRRWTRLESAVAQGCANHAFHVLVVSPWVGLMRDGIVDQPLEIVDQCRISWGRVVGSREGAQVGTIVVERRPVEWRAGRLELGPVAPSTAFTDIPVSDGDVVSLHWGAVCDVISRRQLGWLQWVTGEQLATIAAIGVPD